MSRTVVVALAIAVAGAGARDAPGARPGTPRCGPEPGRRAAMVRGRVSRGERFWTQTTAPWIVELVPNGEGWRLRVSMRGRESEDLARLTPPWHAVPNPRDLAGWHFRNADNTGPNDGGVNAPQELREFIFSPEVGQGIEYEGSATAVEAVERVRAFGRGWLFVESFRLTPPRQGERAAFEDLAFAACLTWPAGR